MADSIRPVNDNYSSAGQPTPEQIQQVAEHGFQSILNLRLPTEADILPDEAEQATTAGLAYAHAPVSNTETQTLYAALAVLDALPQPVLIHCRGGGRATAVALIATAAQTNLTRDQFLEQVSAHGLGAEHPQIQQFLLDRYGPEDSGPEDSGQAGHAVLAHQEVV